ncbi:MAG: ethylbenzene dehydrogenase-related protein [Candidatus Hodarchaeales archaeon]|jgi:hypothetical protein
MMKKKLITVFSIVIFFSLAFTMAVLSAEQADTVALTAYKTTGTIVLDGSASESFWTDADDLIQSDIGGSGVNISIKAANNGTHVFLYATWTDDTKDDTRKGWEYNGTDWLNLGGNEDRLDFLWTNGTNTPVCGHDGGTGYQFDVWHWKATRSAPAGWADDKYMNDVSGSDGGRHGDAKTAGGYKDNSVVKQAAAAAEITTKLGNTTDVSAFTNDDRPYWDSDGNVIAWSGGNNGTELTNFISGYNTTVPSGSRGDVLAASKHDGSAWHVEFMRALDTEHLVDDVKFETGETYTFYLAFHNNSGGGSHKIIGGSSSPTALTMEFSANAPPTSTTTTTTTTTTTATTTTPPPATPGFLAVFGIVGIGFIIVVRRIRK